MKRFAFFLCLLIIPSVTCAAQRLPEIAVPENYTLTWSTDFASNSFTGVETIHVRVLKPTTEIVLNSVDLEFQQVSITSGGTTQQAAVVPDLKKQMISLTVGRSLVPGAATIQISYTGRLNNQLRGFYLGRDEDGNKYAVTQFEATDARRAFPSFDEPAYKATFDMTVVADKGLAVISNSQILSDTPGPSDEKHTVHFATTPKMSSYLLAVAVGRFESIEGSADGIPIRVWAMPGKKQLGTFALETAEHVLTYYDHYFGIKYPYQKLDLIALPDFSAGAMENTACITFRQVLLLINEQHASLRAKKQVASVVAHEMAHQWFGDLVTMQWWNDIWLNEGFATWMSSKPLMAWHPEWHFELDDIIETTRSLNVDSLENTRPIHQEAETPDEILELFDGIAYGKTAAVLRMLEAYMGPDKFRKGVNAYLKEHAYANSTATDFWTALARASGEPVDKIMPTFVQQAGVPLVNIHSECSKGSETVELGQRRYFYNRAAFNANTNENWMIPICLKTGNHSTAKCELLTSQQQKTTLKGCSPWVYGNRSALGYYRSGYTPAALRAMRKDVESSLTPAERIGLLTDSWSGVRVGELPMADYLALAKGFHAERNYAVIAQFLDQLNYISHYLTDEKDMDAFNQWARHLFASTVSEVGWNTRPGDDEEQTLLRAQLMLALGRTGRDPDAQAEATQMAISELDHPGSVEKEMVGPALEVAAIHGDRALYDKVMAHLESSSNPEQRAMYSEVLADFENPELVQRSLEYFISPQIRSQDAPLLLAQLLQNPATQKQSWDFIQSHWKDIEGDGGPFASGRIVRAASSFCSTALRDDLLNFFAAHNNSAQRSLKQSVERINECVDLKSREEPDLSSWLEQHHYPAGE
jgi:aminopeptidase N/puromycin-sensitive aminopeptidase